MTLAELTSHLVTYPTTREHLDQIEACEQWIGQYIQENTDQPVSVEIIKDEGVPSLLVGATQTRSFDILLHGHVDVVVRDESGQFEPRIEGDKLYGRGTGDMKGADAVLIQTFIWARNTYPDLNIGLLLAGDEEQGGFHGTKPLVEAGLETGLLINFDGGYGEQITLGEKGILSLKLTATGTPALVTYPWRADSAYHKIQEAIQIIETQFTENDLASDEDNWHTTFAVKHVSTNPEGDSSTTHEATATGTLCYTHSTKTQELFNQIKEAVRPYANLELQFSAEPVVIDEYSPAVQQFAQAFQEVLGSVTYARENGSSDARFFGSQANEILITKPIGGNIELDDEWVSIQSLGNLFQILQKTITLRIEK